jgi:hypothetical protein
MNGGSISANTKKFERVVIVESSSTTGSITLDAGEKGYVLVKTDNVGGIVTITETNSGSTVILVRTADHDMVYDVIKIGSNIYSVS